MLTDLPDRALSIRQPWAWAIAQGHKPVENRAWGVNHPSRRFRGPVAIHASATLRRPEFDEAMAFIAGQGIECPAPEELRRGAIIATAVVTGTTYTSDSPWFFGPMALILDEVRAIEPIPCRGQLGFFRWKASARQAQPSSADWMQERGGHRDGLRDPSGGGA